ncbi:MAG: alpha/beta hydrolase [Candidatus Nanopelagicales bacterium]
MADEDLETFVVYPGAESIAPTAENEGTNTSRFAIAGALTAPSRVAFDDGLGLVGADTLERFGFSTRLSRADRNSIESFTAIYGEAVAFIERRDSWLNGDGRFQAWSEVAEGDLSARLMLLAAGVCSDLERESAAAAVALVRLLRGNVVVRRLRRGPWDFPPQWWRGPWDRDWPWAWTDERSSAFDEPVNDSEGSVVTWYGERWREFSTEWIAEALIAGDGRFLLSVLLWIATRRAGEASRSSDSVVREFAFSLRWSRSTDDPSDSGAVPAGQSPRAQPLTSTMVHGTWGWKGDWWYPGGDFHSYVKQKFRPRLYSDGMEFAWSGAYRQKQRATAGDRFSRWVRSYSPVAGLGTVFAHSYGGEVVARAINSGAPVDELVLLSAPVNAHHVAALDRVTRVVDVRLDFDIVLALAGEDQRLPLHPRVTECVVDKAFWKHGATHAPEFWHDEDVAARVGL